MTVLTSVEFDHADIFKDLAHIKRYFRDLFLVLTAQSTLIAFDADDNISELAGHAPAVVQRYGKAPDSFGVWGMRNSTARSAGLKCSRMGICMAVSS